MAEKKCKCFLCGGDATQKDVETIIVDTEVIPFECKKNCGNFKVEKDCYEDNKNRNKYILLGLEKDENSGNCIRDEIKKIEFMNKATIVAARRKRDGSDNYILIYEDKYLKLAKQKNKCDYIGLRSFLGLYDN